MIDDRTTTQRVFSGQSHSASLVVESSKVNLDSASAYSVQSASEFRDRPHDSSSNWLGTVLAVQANFYFVRLDRAPQAVFTDTVRSNTVRSNSESSTAESRSLLLCTRRSRLKKIGQDVCVGDRVRVEEPDWQGQRGAIAEVLPRQTELDRPSIANANQIFLVFALAEPELDPTQMSRFLIKAESTGLQVCLGLNKSDLVALQEQQQWRDRLQQWGYEPLIFSLQTDPYGVEIHRRLQNRVTVVSGPSGVGKSSLINHLIPTIDLRVGEVSGKLGRGRHTTRHVELFELPMGGLLADTPGFNQPDLALSPQELAQCFPEIRQRMQAGRCQFKDCLHRDEPNCAVKGDWERYSHYLSMLDEAIAHEETQARTRDEETTLKVKAGESGQSRYEPKLATKKYRRPSRRSQKQELQTLCQDFDTFIDDDDSEPD
ncbi:MAG: small ribosomal subunit biogenesis GTPase RsgA [Elainellaceae cyanobacterium]